MNITNEQAVIWMIEDDAGHARLIEKNLRRSGVDNELIHFTMGQKMLDHLESDSRTAKKPLILLDLNLPDLDGYELLRRIRAHPATRIAPVIILTTTDNPDEITRAYQLGCNVYVTKPIEYEAFADVIQKLGLMLSIIKLPKVL